ncbi:hypothetical protein VTL71DRAFT_10991, partial [Oculimacula yallundae]
MFKQSSHLSISYVLYFDITVLRAVVTYLRPELLVLARRIAGARKKDKDSRPGIGRIVSTRHRRKTAVSGGDSDSAGLELLSHPSQARTSDKNRSILKKWLILLHPVNRA